MAKTFAEFKELAKKDGARIITEGVTDTKGLADAVSFEMKSSGRSEAEYDIQKNMEQKAAMFETKANEIMHTTNTGFGAELVPGNILMTDFVDLIPQVSKLMAFFQGGVISHILPLRSAMPQFWPLCVVREKGCALPVLPQFE